MKSTFRKLSAALAALSLSSPGAYGLETDIGGGYRGEYSNNIGLVPTNEQSEWLNVVFVTAGVREDRPEVTANVAARAEYRDYRRDVFDDEVLANLNATSLWTLSPERLTWTINEFFAQTSTDVQRAPTPTNTQDANAFTTGPDLFLRFGPLSTLQLGARYSNYYFEATDNDSENYTAIARLLYRYSPVTTYSLNSESTHVAFKDDVLNENYTRQDWFLRASTRTVTSLLEIDAGATGIRRERTDNLDGFLGRLTWTRLLDPESQVALFVWHELSDGGREFQAASTGAPGTGVTTTQATSDVIEISQGGVNWNGRSGFFSQRLQVFRRKEDYQIQPLDQDIRAAVFDLGYDFTQTITARIFGDYRQTEFLDTGREDRDRLSGLRLFYRYGRNLTFGLEASLRQRASTDPLQSFDETRGILSVTYSSTRATRGTATLGR